MNNIVTTTNTNLPNGKRVQPSVKELKAMIDKEVEEQVAAKNEFTAYIITLLIRKAYPGLEIVHENVRKYVHNKMDSYNTWSKLAWGYSSNVVQYAQDSATTYSPMLQTVLGSAKPNITVTKPSKKKASTKALVASAKALAASASASSLSPASTPAIAPATSPTSNVKPSVPKNLATKALPAPNNIHIDWGDD